MSPGPSSWVDHFHLFPPRSIHLIMDSLTPRQAQTLFDTGGFLLLTALPEGSEFGIDGTCVSLISSPSRNLPS